MTRLDPSSALSALPACCVHIFLGNAHHSVPMVRFFDTLELAVPQLICTPSAEREAFAKEALSEDLHFYFYEEFPELFAVLAALDRGSIFILHGLFRSELRAQLLRHPDILSRSTWFGWGADFYPPQTTGLRGVVDRLKDAWRELPQKRRIAARCQKVLVCNDGDERLMRARMGDCRIEQLQYPLLGLNDALIAELTASAEAGGRRESEESGRPYVLMVGNSAAESNEHHAVLASIAQLAEDDVRVWSPLNYGGPAEYVESVIAEGRRLFGDKFEPVTEMLSKEAYDERLRQTDAVAFGHRRQQGLYVAKHALCHGTYLFIRREVSTYQRFRGMGFAIGATEDLENMTLSDLRAHDEAARRRNRMLLIDHGSEPALRPQFEALIHANLSEVGGLGPAGG